MFRGGLRLVLSSFSAFGLQFSEGVELIVTVRHHPAALPAWLWKEPYPRGIPGFTSHQGPYLGVRASCNPQRSSRATPDPCAVSEEWRRISGNVFIDFFKSLHLCGCLFVRQ